MQTLFRNPLAGLAKGGGNAVGIDGGIALLFVRRKEETLLLPYQGHAKVVIILYGVFLLSGFIQLGHGAKENVAVVG